MNEMDILSIIAKKLSGFDPLVWGYIGIIFIVFKMTWVLKHNKEKNETMIINFMKEVSKSLKEERVFVYKLIDSTSGRIDILEEQGKQHIMILGELVGEIRGKTNERNNIR